MDQTLAQLLSYLYQLQAERDRLLAEVQQLKALLDAQVPRRPDSTPEKSA